jgi:hypothetical protein
MYYYYFINFLDLILVGLVTLDRMALQLLHLLVQGGPGPANNVPCCQTFYKINSAQDLNFVF